MALISSSTSKPTGQITIILFLVNSGKPQASICLMASMAMCYNPIQGCTSKYTISEKPLTLIAEKRRTMLSENDTSTHNSQSEAGHGPSRDISQKQIMRIGQWPMGMTSAPATPSIALRSQNTIRRTGTDLSNEETTTDIVRPRIHPQAENESVRDSLPQDTSSAESLVVSEDTRLISSRDYYQFEWFWVLIGMIFLMVSEIIIIGLVLFANVVVLWAPILMSVAIGLISSLLYTGIFVILLEYHEAMEKFLDKYACLGPGLQHLCLRVCAYVYACGVIVAIAFVFFKIWL